jgi:hypothetical protein
MLIAAAMSRVTASSARGTLSQAEFAGDVPLTNASPAIVVTLLLGREVRPG